MTDRILPVEEWSKLAHTELGPVLDRLNPARTRIVVVEDADGAILGCWAQLTVEHAEGVWIHPDYRGKTSVARRLWRRMQAVVQSVGAQTFVASAHSPEIHQLLARRARPVPAQEYVVWAQKS